MCQASSSTQSITILASCCILQIVTLPQRTSTNWGRKIWRQKLNGHQNLEILNYRINESQIIHGHPSLVWSVQRIMAWNQMGTTVCFLNRLTSNWGILWYNHGQFVCIVHIRSYFSWHVLCLIQDFRLGEIPCPKFPPSQFPDWTSIYFVVQKLLLT